MYARARNIWRAVSPLAQRLGSRWFGKPRRFRYTRTNEFPDALETSTVYVAGEGEHIWAAAMLCPCGCGDVIELNLLKQTRPCWTVEPQQDGTVTVRPSVWRRKGCRSHFYVRRGRIEWF